MRVVVHNLKLPAGRDSELQVASAGLPVTVTESNSSEHPRGEGGRVSLAAGYQPRQHPWP